jgi:hypothetical protein
VSIPTPQPEQGTAWYSDGDSELDEYEADERNDEVKINEEPIALKDVLRLVEHSAKAIEHMNEHQFSIVWSQCSSNTYGKISACCFVNRVLSFVRCPDC